MLHCYVYSAINKSSMSMSLSDCADARTLVGCILVRLDKSIVILAFHL